MGKYGKWKVIVMSTGAGGFYRQFRGDSSWEKPTEGVETGDELIEVDTAHGYCWIEGKGWCQVF